MRIILTTEESERLVENITVYMKTTGFTDEDFKESLARLSAIQFMLCEVLRDAGVNLDEEWWRVNADDVEGNPYTYESGRE